MRVVIAGAVTSTERVLLKLLESGVEIVTVFGYEPESHLSVSGWVDLRSVARQNNLPFVGFQSINDPAVVTKLTELDPDVLFVVGLSQIVGTELLSIPRLGVVGFHPTRLPAGRGRAPIAWLVLDQSDGAATFFEMSEGVDDGPIFVQEPFRVFEEDDAGTVELKILAAIEGALDRWVPELLAGQWTPIPQNHDEATWFGKRVPEDGLISWSASMAEVVRLVRASTAPHPGSFTPSPRGLVRVWEAEPAGETRYRGAIGRVLEATSDGRALVQARDAPVWLTRYVIEDGTDTRLKVGDQLGYIVEAELIKIKDRLARLEAGFGR